MMDVGLKLLLLEDDPAIRGEQARLLAAAGFAVDAVDSLSAARMAVERCSYDVAVLDLQLQDGTAYDLLELFAQRADAPAIVVVSSTMDLAVRARCMELGARDFVSKPFQPAELVRRVKRSAQGGPASPAVAEAGSARARSAFRTLLTFLR